MFGGTAQGLRHRLVGDVGRLPETLAHHHLGHHARGGHGGAAAERLELDVGDPVLVIDGDADAHHIAADRVADLADAVGVLDLPHVARVREVVHDQVGVHRSTFHVQRTHLPQLVDDRREGLQERVDLLLRILPPETDAHAPVGVFGAKAQGEHDV